MRKARQREFCGQADRQAMLALARVSPGDNVHVVDLPYRLSSWALDTPGNIGMWIDTRGQLLAWAVLQTPFWTVDYVCHPQAGPDLHRQVLAWADHRARQVLDSPVGRPCWFVMVFADQAERICDLEESGFRSQANVGQESWSQVLMHCSLQNPVAGTTLPAGMVIRPSAGEEEVAAYVQLHRAIFQSENMTADWRTRSLRCPEYVPDLDLVAVAPSGELVAFCVCWLGRDTDGRSMGQVEPLGVHERFRRVGVGRALLSEGFRRLLFFGAEGVYVETDSYRSAAMALYEAAGFRVAREVLVYRQDYGRGEC